VVFFVEGEGVLFGAVEDVDLGDDGAFEGLVVGKSEFVGEFEVGVFFAGEDFLVGAFLEPAPVVFHVFGEDVDVDLLDEGEVEVGVGFGFVDPDAEGGLEGGVDLAFELGVVGERDGADAGAGGGSWLHGAKGVGKGGGRLGLRGGGFDGGGGGGGGGFEDVVEVVVGVE